jgi:predicted transcriptional regulator
LGPDPYFEQLLKYLILGSRGGTNRGKIIAILRERPRNPNQIARELGIQYKAVQHHLKVLSQNNLLVTQGEKYGVLYALSPYLVAKISSFEKIWALVDTKEQLVQASRR